MRWRSSLAFLILLLGGTAIWAQSPQPAPQDAADSTDASVAPVSASGNLPPIVDAQRPALYDPRANMAWVEGREISWLMPDASGRKRAKEGVKRNAAGFYMDRTEVTNTDFAQFLSASDSNAIFYDSRMDIVDIGHGQYRARLGREKFPVAWVDWTTAFAFAKWAGKSLPTEDEWMVAALSGRALRADTVQYVWNDSTQCNHLSAGHLPERVAVGSFAQVNTASGLVDLAGNVAEWTLTEEPSPMPADKNHKWVVVKGGSFLDTPESITVFGRALRDRGERLSSLGFRCILRDQAAR